MSTIEIYPKELTLASFSLAKVTRFLLSFLANMMLSLWMMLLQLISSTMSSQLTSAVHGSLMMSSSMMFLGRQLVQHILKITKVVEMLVNLG